MLNIKVTSMNAPAEVKAVTFAEMKEKCGIYRPLLNPHKVCNERLVSAPGGVFFLSVSQKTVEHCCEDVWKSYMYVRMVGERYTVEISDETP